MNIPIYPHIFIVLRKLGAVVIYLLRHNISIRSLPRALIRHTPLSSSSYTSVYCTNLFSFQSVLGRVTPYSTIVAIGKYYYNLCSLTLTIILPLRRCRHNRKCYHRTEPNPTDVDACATLMFSVTISRWLSRCCTCHFPRVFLSVFPAAWKVTAHTIVWPLLPHIRDELLIAILPGTCK